MRKWLLFSVLTTLLLTPLLTSAQADLPITIIDAEGNEVTITSLDRIVSGIGDITEVLYELGYYDHIVGVDSTSTFPEGTLDVKEVIGFGRRLALEPIIAVDPTVIFCSQVCGPPDVMEQIRALGIPLVITPDREDGGLELPFEKIDMIAAAVGETEKGEDLKARLRQEYEWVDIALSNAYDEQPSVMHLYVRAMGLQLAGGIGTPAQYMIEGAGGIDAGAETGVVYYQSLTPEVLFAAFPDYLLFTEGSIESAGGLEEVLKIQGVGDTPAAQNGNLIVMDTAYLLNMSTRTGQALIELASYLHPNMTWEVQVPYPYTVTDATATEITVEETSPIFAFNEDLQTTIGQLGFHPVQRNEADNSDLIITAESDDWQALREAGFTVIVVPDDADIAALAAALGVPGRGEALQVYRGE